MSKVWMFILLVPVSILLGAMSYLYVMYPEETYGLDGLYHIPIIYGLIGIAMLYAFIRYSLSQSREIFYASYHILGLSMLILCMIYIIGFGINLLMMVTFVMIALGFGVNLYVTKKKIISLKQRQVFFVLLMALMYVESIYIFILLFVMNRIH